MPRRAVSRYRSVALLRKQRWWWTSRKASSVENFRFTSPLCRSIPITAYSSAAWVQTSSPMAKTSALTPGPHLLHGCVHSTLPVAAEIPVNTHFTPWFQVFRVYGSSGWANSATS